VLVEGVHFRRDWSSALRRGPQGRAANLADVAAMGATATALLVGLAAPGDLPVEWATSLADGLRDEAARTGRSSSGGDTVTADRVVVSVTALGDLAGRRRSRVRARGRATSWCSRAHRLVQRRPRPAAGRLHDGPLVEAHRRPSPPYAPVLRWPTPGRRRCATSATGSSPTSGTSRGPAAS
jgi:thiamine-monophosphate kinase